MRYFIGLLVATSAFIWGGLFVDDGSPFSIFDNSTHLEETFSDGPDPVS